jgi:hypothetical protein
MTDVRLRVSVVHDEPRLAAGLRAVLLQQPDLCVQPENRGLDVVEPAVVVADYDNWLYRLQRQRDARTGRTDLPVRHW